MEHLDCRYLSQIGNFIKVGKRKGLRFSNPLPAGRQQQIKYEDTWGLIHNVPTLKVITFLATNPPTLYARGRFCLIEPRVSTIDLFLF